MPSVFPGMDPFLESDEWESFHSKFVDILWDTLVPSLRPRYSVRSEKRVYVESNNGTDGRHIRPDVTVLRTPDPGPAGGGRSATIAVLQPVECSMPAPLETIERYLVIRNLESHEVVTVIELLSPANKRPGVGRDKYLEKREEILQSDTHLVEIDLLRGGQRSPLGCDYPPGDYFVNVCRRETRSRASVYGWPLNHPLPVIPIPLAGDDPDVMLNLQDAFNTVYDKAGYDYSLDYKRPLSPLLNDAEAAWAKGLLKA